MVIEIVYFKEKNNEKVKNTGKEREIKKVKLFRH